MATDPAPAMQIARRSCRRRNRSGKAPGSLPLLLLSATWGTIIVAPLTSTLAAAAIVEESPSPPRLPSFPSVAEAVGSAAAVAVISDRSELSERQLKHTSREHWLPRAVESLRAQGRVGDIVSVRALPTREEREEEEGGGEEASHPSATNATVFERFLIAHRGFGRCCNAWCMPAGTDPRDARHWGISRCGGAAIREAPVLLLARRRGRPGGQRRRQQQQQHQRRRQQRSKNEKNESGKAGGEPADFVVEREYLAGKLFMPHSVTLGPVSVASPSASASASTPGSEPSAEVFYVVDHLLDQVLTVSLATGAEVGPRLGTPWSLAALRRGADLGAFAGAHRAFYPRAAVEEEEERGRLQGGGSVGGGGGGGSVLVEPTAAVGTRDGARVFVGSGYLDARVVAFDPRSGAVVAQVARLERRVERRPGEVAELAAGQPPQQAERRDFAARDEEQDRGDVVEALVVVNGRGAAVHAAAADAVSAAAAGAVSAAAAGAAPPVVAGAAPPAVAFALRFFFRQGRRRRRSRRLPFPPRLPQFLRGRSLVSYSLCVPVFLRLRPPLELPRRLGNRSVDDLPQRRPRRRPRALAPPAREGPQRPLDVHIDDRGVPVQRRRRRASLPAVGVGIGRAGGGGGSGREPLQHVEVVGAGAGPEEQGPGPGPEGVCAEALDDGELAELAEVDLRSLVWGFWWWGRKWRRVSEERERERRGRKRRKTPGRPLTILTSRALNFVLVSLERFLTSALSSTSATSLAVSASSADIGTVEQEGRA